MTIGELASGKLSGYWAWKLLAVSMVVGNGAEVRVWNTDRHGEIVRVEGE
jgi:hypothetical protein